MPPKTVRLGPDLKLAHTTHNVGGWLSHKPGVLKAFIAKLWEKAKTFEGPLYPTVQAFQDLIESDPYAFVGATKMINQVPAKYQHDPSGGPRLRNYKQMCRLINAAVSEPPPYNDTELVAFPINAILDWSMGTPAGTHFFLDEKVNKALKAILDAWGSYLCTEASLVAFEDPPEGGGWMCPEAVEKLSMDMFILPNPDALGWGYKSWNEFFIREFKPGMRPIACENDDAVIISACESTPFALQNNVQLRDRFWIKQQPYSLEFMLGNDPHASKFVGGTVYQAFLNAFNYHRWHSPVSGKVVKKKVIPGSYYAEALSEGFDEGGPNLSQSYITNYAARGVIFIKADNADIGLMAVVTVGMAEVSSNVITVNEGDKIAKGDQLGYFQFGGSTHCLVFQKDVISEWSANAIPSPSAGVVPLHSWLARAGSNV